MGKAWEFGVSVHFEAPGSYFQRQPWSDYERITVGDDTMTEAEARAIAVQQVHSERMLQRIRDKYPHGAQARLDTWPGRLVEMDTADASD